MVDFRGAVVRRERVVGIVRREICNRVVIQVKAKELKDYLLAAKRQAGGGRPIHERELAKARRLAKSIKARQPDCQHTEDSRSRVFLTVVAGVGWE